MRRPLVLLALGAALTGCGAAGSVDRIAAWEDEVPYLPPRAPKAAPAGESAGTSRDRAAPVADAAAGTDRAPRPASGAPSDAQVAAELEQAFEGAGGKGSDLVDRATLTSDGLATIPPTAPRRLAAIIRAANVVARKPYVYGGGHGGGPEGIFQDTAYDCSGSISYALASAGFLEAPTDSTGLSRFGKPGKGRWVTIYANAGHAFMVVAGLRFDTSGRQRTGTRWQTAPRTVSGMTVRHPPGL